MKSAYWLITFTLFSLNYVYAQNTTNCTGHPLFSNIANHIVKSCETKEFEKLDLYKTDKTKGSVSFEKSGEYIKVANSYTGDFNSRPSSTQIYQNYANAITKAGGEVLYNGSSGIYGKLQKSGDTYWIKVYTDGSGWHWLESVKESSMRQDVVVTSDEIKNSIKNDGKALFYGIYFDTDKATLKSESEPTLIQMAKYLKENPGVNVFIVGHTDNTGNYSHNLSLSKERAIAVINELTTKYGVNKNQLTAEGVGPLSPVTGNATENGKAKNRRVEMVLK